MSPHEAAPPPERVLVRDLAQLATPSGTASPLRGPELGAVDVARRSHVKPKRALRPLRRACCNGAAGDMHVKAIAGLGGTISKPDSPEPLRMLGQSGQADNDA